jgi:hypothetical protein
MVLLNERTISGVCALRLELLLRHGPHLHRFGASPVRGIRPVLSGN